MKWQIDFLEIPNTVKAAFAIGMLAIVGFTYHDKFITEAEASESARIQWINDVEAEIRALKRSKRMVKDPEILKMIDEDMKDLKEKLECLRTADESKVKFC